MKVSKKQKTYLKYRYGENWEYYMDYWDIFRFNESCKHDLHLENMSAKDIQIATKCDPLHAEQEWSLHDEQKDPDEPQNYVIIKEEHNDWHHSYTSYVIKVI